MRDYCVDVAKGRGALPFGLVGQESTCDWRNTWTWSERSFFFLKDDMSVLIEGV